MRHQDYSKSGLDRVQAMADWAAFEALCFKMATLVQDGREKDALVICEELERYLRGEGFSWSRSEDASRSEELVHE